MVEWPSFLLSTADRVLYWSEEKQVTLDSEKGPYYGITWDENHIYYTRGSGLSPHGRDQLVASNGSNIIREFPGYFPGAHQIIYYAGHVYITVTSRNAVAKVSVLNGQESFFNWTGHDQDVNHINGIWRDVDCWWVCYHNYAEKSDTSAVNSRIAQLCEKFENVVNVVDLGVGIHNCVRVGNTLYICSSAENRLLLYDLSESNVVRDVCDLNWVRGLSITSDYLVLGVSEVAVAKSDRLLGDAAVYLLDRKTLDILDKKVFSGTGPVYGLRVTSVEDLAHNNIKFPGIN